MLVHIHLNTTESTHEEMKRMLHSAISITADKQTKGHGQGTKRWWSPEGMGLYLTMNKEIPNIHPDALTSMIGHRIVMTLRSYTLLRIYQQGINDIYLDGRKLGGILCEIYNGRFIISIGLNLFRPNKVRKDLQRNAVWLNEFGAEHLINGQEIAKLLIGAI